ncbi:MAG TPA: hypothetical protein VFW09_15870, partial [Solirubrobacteraceae bacterium]|nr:hypothetical protein [Solirubrobacteraceae bacterium]
PGERARSSPPATRSGCTALGASAIFTMHPQIIGRPSRLAILDDFISFVAAHEDVRIDTCAAIADRVP